MKLLAVLAVVAVKTVAAAPAVAEVAHVLQVGQVQADSAAVMHAKQADLDEEGTASNFALAISENGRILAIGSYGSNSSSGTDRGTVRMYRKSNSTGEWSQMGETIYGGSSRDYAGRSVSLSDDGLTLAIGAYYADTSSHSGTGQVEVYSFDSVNWVPLGTSITGASGGEHSGSSVSISANGRVIAIGAPGASFGGINSGRTRVYEYVEAVSDWALLGSAIDGCADSMSGYSVSLSADGQAVAVGAYDGSGTGAKTGTVKVYRICDDSWTQIGAEISGDGFYDRAGWSVAIDDTGSTLAVGSPYSNSAGGDSGRTSVYKLVNDTCGTSICCGEWELSGMHINGANPDDYCGIAVDLSANGQTVAMGAFGNDDAGSHAGEVRIFKMMNDSWTQLGADLHGSGWGDQTGKSVALSGNGKTIAVGAPYAMRSDLNLTDTSVGYVKIYSYSAATDTWTQEGGDILGSGVFVTPVAFSASVDGSGDEQNPAKA